MPVDRLRPTLLWEPETRPGRIPALLDAPEDPEAVAALLERAAWLSPEHRADVASRLEAAVEARTPARGVSLATMAETARRLREGE